MGTVRKVIVEYLQDFLMVPHEKLGHKQAAWRVDPAQSGIGGTLGDVGTHCVNLLEYVTGDPIVELCADKSTFLPDRTLDEDVNVLLRFRGGGKGVLTISQVATGEENGLRLRVYRLRGGGAVGAGESERAALLSLRRAAADADARTGRISLRTRQRLHADSDRASRRLFRSVRHDLLRRRARHPPASRRQAAAADEYDFPTVYDGLRGMQFITKAVESCEKGSVWVKM